MKDKKKQEIANRIVEIESILNKNYDPDLIDEIQELIKDLDFKDLIEVDEEIVKRMDKCD